VLHVRLEVFDLGLDQRRRRRIVFEIGSISKF
jgi:hypothetical protein